MRAVVADTDDNKKIIQQVIPLARRIANESGWIQESFYECDPDQGFGITVLHEFIVVDDQDAEMGKIKRHYPNLQLLPG